MLVWDEQQPQQSQGYGEKFLGETLATELAKNQDLVVKTARLAGPPIKGSRTPPSIRPTCWSSGAIAR
ncbi:hypothetical protein EMGBS6_12460 [Opitutia bacterium]|nr:hypothetical protein EMGBS6_12460 [Opitutae bacterium]